MNINELDSLLIDLNPAENSPEVCDLINGHNASVVAFSQGLAITAITSLLVDKGIVTEGEMEAKLNECLTQADRQARALYANAQALLEFVKSDSEFNSELKKMHDSVNNDTSSEEAEQNLSAKIVNVFPSEDGVNNTEE